MASRALKRLNWPYIIISGHYPNLLRPTNFFKEALFITQANRIISAFADSIIIDVVTESKKKSRPKPGLFVVSGYGIVE